MTGDGLHTATAQTATGSDSTFFLVDSTAPSITFGAPAANAAFDQSGPNASSFNCTDAGIGVQSCTGASTFDTTGLGFHMFSVTAKDLLNHIELADRHLRCDQDHDAGAGCELRTRRNGQLQLLVWDAAAGTTCNATVTRLTPAPAGLPAANTNGQALPTTIAGTYSYAVTLSDGAGGHTRHADAHLHGRSAAVDLGQARLHPQQPHLVDQPGRQRGRAADRHGRRPGSVPGRPARQVARRHEGRLRTAHHGEWPVPALGDRRRRAQPACS